MSPFSFRSDQFSPSRRLRDKILCVVGVAGAGIAGSLRVGENRTRANNFAGCVTGFAKKLIRRLAFLHPSEERKEQAVKVGCRAGAAETVIDAGDEEQTRKFCRLWGAAHLFLHALVVIDRPLVRNPLVRQAMQAA